MCEPEYTYLGSLCALNRQNSSCLLACAGIPKPINAIKKVPAGNQSKKLLSSRNFYGCGKTPIGHFEKLLFVLGVCSLRFVGLLSALVGLPRELDVLRACYP